ncbi:hypothetical protein DN730_13290 [Marinomonas piezotolerans]|uniref:Uncharacterized protein n=1 Tax=Marinomonas piezotolerans TaxID=2213058 RepID=A0A370U7I4_9GAMM|nr:hypothetical protein [Marinomonas piezotolerans]RDL43715.1 hypothetical protein DN730_13290 [Marinomonas piezotolerans]
MTSIPGISSGGGDISPDLSATATNTGGTNALGGFAFGNYSKSKGVSPLLIGGVVVVALWFMFKGGKR